MADWYTAGDGAVKTGLTFATIGASGYATLPTKAAHWSEFAANVWPLVNSGDTIHMLVTNRPFGISNAAGWVALACNKTGVTFRWENVDGTAMRGSPLKGTRDFPWPKAGQTAVYAGEVFMTATNANCVPVFDHGTFEHLKSIVQPNTSQADLGTVTFNDCYALNVSRALFYTEARADGRCAIVMTRSEAHGYDKGNARFWPNNSGLGITLTDCYLDSEHQNDNSSFNSASTPSGFHVMDPIPTLQTVKAPITLTRCVFVNHRAGYTGSTYPQGDGGIGEEGAGTIIARDILTWGNGDRGIDLKCAGTIVRHISLGDAYALGHHLDTVPVDVYLSVYYTGARLTTSGAPPSVACVQASGWTRVFKSWLGVRPTAAQVAANNFAATTGSVDPHKWQGQVYGAVHQGKVELTDVYELVKTSTGATETTGYSGAGVNGRVGVVFGLTPSTSYQFKVRALGQDGTAGAYTSLISATMSADGGGERVAPAAPTNFTATQVAGAPQDLLFTWTNVAEDSGTPVQGYIVEVDFADGNGFIPFLPGKSCTPVTLSGFQPGTPYTARVRSFDSNMNVSAASNTASATTAAGSVTSNTPAAPTNIGQDSQWIDHCTAFGIGSPTGTSGFTAPSGTISLYEIRDSSDVLKTRMGSIRLASQDTPILTKTNVNLLNV